MVHSLEPEHFINTSHSPSLNLRKCGSVLQTSAIMLAGMSVALPRIALAHSSSVHSHGRRHRHIYVTGAQLQVIDAALEARVQWQVVRQRRKVCHIVSAQVQHRCHLHLGLTARCPARHIHTIVHGEPRLATNPPHMDHMLSATNTVIDIVVAINAVLHRFRRKNAPWSSAHVPCQHHVALDETHCQMVRPVVVIPRLTDEGEQRDLVQRTGRDPEAQLHFVVEGYCHRIRYIRGHSVHTARERGMRYFQVCKLIEKRTSVTTEQ